MSEVKITLQPDEEIEKILKSILTLQTEILSRLTTGKSVLPESCVNEHPVDAVAPATAEDAAPAEQPKRTKKHAEPSDYMKPTPVAEPAPAPVHEKQYTTDDIKALVVALVQKGKRTEAKQIINEYAPSVTGIPNDKLAEVAKKLEAIA